jgi:nitroimidazol reductase NimA-like FMN-containing flavoprotein (pyridoxamine 5'-phosphate oxidase superfamily)
MCTGDPVAADQPAARLLEVLGDAESLELLASMPVGRLVVTEQALPNVLPVSFVVDGRALIVRTSPDSRLASATRGTVVAFEADDIDLTTRSGWSVTVVGHATHVTDAAELDRLETLPLRPWAACRGDRFIRIEIELVRGRRLADPQDTPRQ